MSLTATQEDYLETIYRLGDPDSEGVRATDIAENLGCRLPTVTRTVQKMAEMGFVHHEARGRIRLTYTGQKAAENIAHRHTDTVAFLMTILGLNKEEAEADACQIEHGLSPLAAQRLHEFLEYVERLDEKSRRVIGDFARSPSETISDFAHLPNGRTAGWRG